MQLPTASCQPVLRPRHLLVLPTLARAHNHDIGRNRLPTVATFPSRTTRDDQPKPALGVGKKHDQVPGKRKVAEAKNSSFLCAKGTGITGYLRVYLFRRWPSADRTLWLPGTATGESLFHTGGPNFPMLA